LIDTPGPVGRPAALGWPGSTLLAGSRPPRLDRSRMLGYSVATREARSGPGMDLIAGAGFDLGIRRLAEELVGKERLGRLRSAA
jgi:hypothetical protein